MEAAQDAIDELADAVERGDREKAISLLAKKHGSPEEEVSVLFLQQGRTAQYLRSRSFIEEKPSFYLFQVGFPGSASKQFIRVYRRNAGDGIYEDEGIEPF